LRRLHQRRQFIGGYDRTGPGWPGWQTGRPSAVYRDARPSGVRVQIGVAVKLDLDDLDRSAAMMLR